MATQLTHGDFGWLAEVKPQIQNPPPPLFATTIKSKNIKCQVLVQNILSWSNRCNSALIKSGINYTNQAHWRMCKQNIMMKHIKKK